MAKYMTTEQMEAQGAYAPAPTEARTQHARILDAIAEQGFITKWGAIYSTTLHCSKLSTRLGEIEDKAGIKFCREMIYHTDSRGHRHKVGMKYWLPAGVSVQDIRKKMNNN